MPMDGNDPSILCGLVVQFSAVQCIMSINNLSLYVFLFLLICASPVLTSYETVHDYKGS